MTARPPTPARILVVGGGGREHALAWKLATDPGVREVIVAPGSDAIGSVPGVRCLPGVAVGDPASVVAGARETAADLVVVGPEAPLAAGVVDALESAGIVAFGPTAAAARIESSKGFCRSVAESVGVRMARGRAFDAQSAAVAFARELAAGGAGVVVKADGLAAGKGVTVCATIEEAEAVLGRLFAQHARSGGGPRAVVEERLVGREASVIAIFDGCEYLVLPVARDHKRLRDGELGPNTGGMGGFSPLPEVADSDAERLVATVHRPIFTELARRGAPFRGALFANLMLTAEGPALLECNARFGDPETQMLLPRLDVALAPLLAAAAMGTLGEAAEALGLRSRLLPVSAPASAGIVLAAAGYPERPRSGDPIEGLAEAGALGALLFHAGTVRDDAGRYWTNGGRVLTVVGLGDNLAAAHALADSAADAISFDGRQRRRDFVLGVAVGVDGTVPIGAAP